MRTARRLLLVVISIALFTGLVVACAPPEFDTAVVVDELDHPWDIGFLPNGTMLVTERAGRLSRVVNGSPVLIVAPSDVFVASEAGMLGLAVDPQFVSNGYVFVCMASTLPAVDDVRVVRFTLNQTGTSVLARQDIVTG